jgi:CheY-like chemotaxis protein
VASNQRNDEAARILLVEDSPADRLLVERLFRDGKRRDRSCNSRK